MLQCLYWQMSSLSLILSLFILFTQFQFLTIGTTTCAVYFVVYALKWGVHLMLPCMVFVPLNTTLPLSV